MKVFPLMWLLIFCTVLLSCSSQESDTVSVSELRKPSLNQLTIRLPKGLVEGEAIERLTGLTGDDYQVANLVPKLLKKVQSDNKPTRMSFAVEQQDSVSVWEINPFLTGGVDPFFVGENGVQEDGVASQTSCPANGPEEPGTLFGPNGAYQGMCFARAMQIALKRIVSDYNTTITIITSLSQFFDNEVEGVVHTFTQPTIETQAGTGLIIKFLYNCIANCSQVPASRDYAYTLTFSPSSEPSNIAGRADWQVLADGSTSGTLAINSDMMSPNGLICNSSNCLPPQIQYEFESDAEGNARNFTMKYAPASFNDEFFHEATIVRMERKPETVDSPAVWVVQGQVNYLVSLALNPARDNTRHASFASSPVSMLFTAVAEDELAGGRAVYNAILANSNGLPNANSLPSDADTQLHLWGAYKKMLEARYTEDYYRSLGLASGRSAWPFIRSGDNYFLESLPRVVANVPESAPQLERYKAILALDISKDGRWLVAGAGEGTLTVADMQHSGTGFNEVHCQPYGALANGESAILSLSVSNDGSRILTMGSDSVVRLLDRSTCNEIASIATNATNCTEFDIINFHQVKFNPYINDEFFTATADIDQVIVRRWLIEGSSLSMQAEITMAHMSILEDSAPTNECIGAGQLDVSAHGRYALVAMQDSTARIWDRVQNSELILRVPGYTTNQLLEGTLVSAVFNEDATQIFASGYSKWGTRGFYRFENRNDLVVNQQYVERDYEWLATNDFRVLRFSHDYSRLVGISNTDVIDGASMATVFTVDETGIPVANVSSRALFRQTKAAVLKPPFNDIFLTGAASGDDPFKVWLVDAYNNSNHSVSLNLPYIGHDGAVTRVDFNADASRVLTASPDNLAILWDTKLGSPITRFEGHTDSPVFSGFSNLTAFFADNDSKVISASFDHTMRLWDLDGNVLQTYTGHNSEVTSAQANNDFTQIVSTARNGEIRIWDPALPSSIAVISNAHTIANANVDSAKFAAFSTDGSMIVSGGTDKHVKIWDATTTPPTFLREYIHDKGITYVEFSPSGDRIAFGDQFGKGHIIRTIDASHVVSFTHTNCRSAGSSCFAPSTVAATFSPHDNGKQLMITVHSFTIGSNVDSARFIKVFDADENSPTFGSFLYSLNEPGQSQNQGPLFGAMFSQDGSRIIAGYNGGKFRDSWVDFDALWAANRNTSSFRDGEWALPGEQVNPYFLTPVNSTSASICFMHDEEELNACGQSCPCKFGCDQVQGGCTIYTSMSTFRHNHLGTDSPINEADYADLNVILNSFANSYYTDSFSRETLHAIE